MYLFGNYFVFKQAEKEEKEIYLKSPRRQVYINLCVNRIKTLRDASDQSDQEVTKRNPLASKSTLPSPTKRLRIDPSASASVAKVIHNIDNNVGLKPKDKIAKDEEMTGSYSNKKITKVFRRENTVMCSCLAACTYAVYEKPFYVNSSYERY